MKKVTKAIIPAAGLGTRFLPATKAMPKEMLPVLDKPTIQYIVEEAVQAGITDIIIVTGKHKRAIEDHFDHQRELEENLKMKGKYDELTAVEHSTNLANIFYVRQKAPKGLGHAVSAAKQFIGDDPCAILLGDDILEGKDGTSCIGQIIEQYEKTGSSVIGVQTVAEQDVHRYGIVEYDEKKDDLYTVSNMFEKPDPTETDSRLAIMGRYVLTPEIFDELDKGIIGAGGEIQLTDAILAMKKDGNKVYAYDFKGDRFDVGHKRGFVKANIDFALRSDEMRDEILSFMKEKLAEYNE
ncbi:MAG TPA: UTP--glucose-1-phosphate uridylyltransferase GalU [Aliicoccus persicus]|uniref:UTP--glucose-1-phosphate uridylyltransferase n=1 Tax=Aliicoccus persicus TaxID=930138 RepID=A0A921JCF4_9STAP|nr:UTP--glucose-1-phosphate uridylyltransferase GalU [Aliicoccus persicus]